MGDRTYYQLTLADVPGSDVNAVIDILAEHGFNVDDNEVEIGEAYFIEEHRVGETDFIANALAEQAPDTSFFMWEDPRYEWLGDARWYTPQLGMYAAECAESGMFVFTADEVIKLAQLPEPDLRKAVGAAHIEAIEALLESNKGETVTRRLDGDE